eukprot:1499396-Amphidinium_carterae.1
MKTFLPLSFGVGGTRGGHFASQSVQVPLQEHAQQAVANSPSPVAQGQTHALCQAPPQDAAKIVTGRT